MDRLVGDLALPTSLTQFQHTLAALTRQLGFEHYLLVVVAGRCPRLINLLHNFEQQVPAADLACGDWLARVQSDPVPEAFYPGAWPAWLRHGLAASASSLSFSAKAGARLVGQPRHTLILERGHSVFDDPAAEALISHAQHAVWGCSAGLRIANVLDRPPAQELACLELAYQGRSYKEIGHALGISDRTAETYLKRSRKRLGVHSTTQACLMASDRGWFQELDPDVLREYVSCRSGAVKGR